MRYLIIITAFLLLPNIFFAQMTYVPDDRFEQELIDRGYDSGPLNDSVPTANIEGLTWMDIINERISNLTGIEDFTDLRHLYCGNNYLTSLDISNNTALNVLSIEENQLTSLDVSKNVELKELYCLENNLTSLDLSNNSDLKILMCSENNLTSLDLSKNSSLQSLWCLENKLIKLNIKNGNNKNMTSILGRFYFDALGNPNLSCVQVDDSSLSANSVKWRIDPHAHYSEDCGYTGVEEFSAVEPEISIFPNPADKNFTVSFELETPKTLTMTLTDLSGRELQEFTLENIQYVNEEIDVSGFSSGVYFLRIDFGGGSVSKKIVVE